ncbi:MAG: hypothetical protein U9Q33_07690 [Campylobacterota bacterium]|nr:hypothetical protein [Campylobacterota bacterium]
MLALKIDDPVIENYFHDESTIKRVLEFIAINKIDINNKEDLTSKLHLALDDVLLMVEGKKEEKKDRDFLDEL